MRASAEITSLFYGEGVLDSRGRVGESQQKMAADMMMAYNPKTEMLGSLSAIVKGLSRNDVTFLGGRGVSQKVTKSDRGEGGSQPKSDDTK